MSLAAARKYQATSIESASRGQILVALYDGCLRYCRAAKLQIEAGDVAGKGQLIGKAIAILGELRSTLDHGVAPELCERLDQLYVFFQEQLSLANIKMDPSFIDPVTRILSDLRDAWETAVSEVESAKAA